MAEEKTLNVNWDICLKLSVLVVLLYFLYLIKDLVIWFIFALVLAILFNFPIDLHLKLFTGLSKLSKTFISVSLIL